MSYIYENPNLKRLFWFNIHWLFVYFIHHSWIFALIKTTSVRKGSFKLPMYGGKKQRTPQWIQYFREHPTWNYTWGSTPRWVCRCKYICSLLDTDWIICIYNICKETLQPTCSHPTCIFRLFTVLWTFDFLEQLTAPWQSELFVKSAQQHRFLRQHRSVPSLHHISPPGQ